MPVETRRRALLLFAVAGALGGYLLHRLVGCPGGGCPITGSPLISTAYGTLVGVVLGIGLLPTRGDRA